MEFEEGRIIRLINDFLTPQFNKKSFLLKFTYNEKEYTTQFEAKHTDNELEIINPCVNMLFEYKNPNGVSAFVGGIESNSKEKKCFSPMLVTNARTDAKNKVGKRTTAADVLQILKSKLALAFPVNAPVTLNDGAQKDGIMIAPFNILRGGDAFYEKYGYKSPIIDEIKTAIRNYKWSDLTEEQKYHIRDATSRDYDAEASLVEIMKTVSWSDEKEYLTKTDKNGNQNRLSYRVFRLFAPKFGKTVDDFNQFSLDGVWKFTLDTEDARWIKSNSELVFTDFKEIQEGAKRKTRKVRKAMKTRRNRLT